MKESKKQADATARREKADMRDNQRQANDAARRERARSIIDGQPTRNGLRILDGNAEQLLRFILDIYDGGDGNRVWSSTDNVPENLQPSFSLELEKLIMYGVISSASNYGPTWEAYLTPKGKSYFTDKEVAQNTTPAYEVSATQRKQYDVFISHASKDKLAYVDSLYVSLRRLGIHIFYDSEEITWGDNWKDVILDGVAKSEFAIIVISKSFFGREWTERELNEFLQRQNESEQKIILPLLYEVSYEDLKNHYPELEFIQSINSDKSFEEIAILMAKELIKRYR